jgi:HEPN domain-containing protein
MKPETAEWVEKAEGDFRTARRELFAPDSPNYDAVCFH